MFSKRIETFIETRCQYPRDQSLTELARSPQLPESSFRASGVIGVIVISRVNVSANSALKPNTQPAFPNTRKESWDHDSLDSCRRSLALPRRYDGDVPEHHETRRRREERSRAELRAGGAAALKCKYQLNGLENSLLLSRSPDSCIHSADRPHTPF